MMSCFRLTAAALGLGLLAGCATSQSVTEPRQERQAGDWEAQTEQVEAFTSWNLTGKVGLRTPQESTSANLDWRQTPYHYRLLVTGPMGAGRSTLEGRDGRVSLTTSEGRFEADSPEALMEQRLGWSLPVSSLTDWVRGLPADDSDFEIADDELGFPASLEQDGWEIDYRGWKDVNGTWLPNRLVMTYDDLRATLVVNQWQPLEQ